MRLLQKALTFDDVLLVPAYSEVLPRDVQLRTRLTREITGALLSGGGTDRGTGRIVILSLLHKYFPQFFQHFNR